MMNRSGCNCRRSFCFCERTFAVTAKKNHIEDRYITEFLDGELNNVLLNITNKVQILPETSNMETVTNTTFIMMT